MIPLLSESSHCHFLALGCLWAGPTMAPTSGSAESGNLSIRGWCLVFGQNHLPREKIHCSRWAARDYTPSEAPSPGGGPSGPAVERNLAQTLQHSMPLQPGDPSICQGSSSRRLYVGYCAAGGQDSTVNSDFLRASLPPVYCDSNYLEA